MNEDMPQTDQELRERFAYYHEIFNGDDAGKKLDAAADMLRILQTYIENYIPDIEVWPLTQVVAELSKIALGGEAEFIKPKEKKPGQPIDPMYNLQQASLIAAIEILKKNGFKLSAAFSYVEDRCWLTKKQLEQLRKDYGRGIKWEVSVDFVFAQSRIDFVSEQAALAHVDNLLTLANRSDQKS